MSSPFYSFLANTIKHQPFDFKSLQGKVIVDIIIKVVLVVNTASKCGMTPQYEGLEKLHKAYSDKGLVILGFPCNQFGKQEPEGEEGIQTFCQLNYGVSFQMMEKIDVNGDDAHPLYQWLKKQKSSLMMETIKWNFEKFLIDQQGNVVDRFVS